MLTSKDDHLYNTYNRDFTIMCKQSAATASIEDIITIFNHTFYSSLNTKLVSGNEEPLYQPADEHIDFHQIIFAHGYFSSALHELAHWLVAGEKRRRRVDYGYWYEPDGRTQQQQAEFEKVEILPQAIEWALAVSCGVKFDVSSDNLSGIVINRLAFKKKVHQQVLVLLENGFSARTNQLLTACRTFYQVEELNIEDFDYQGMYQLV